MTKPFEGVFGNTCELRLLEFLLPLEGIEFNISELSEEAGVSRVTAGRVVRRFVEWGILNASNARIPQYSINPASPIVQSIEIMNNALIGRMLGDEKLREIRTFVHHHEKKVIPVTPETSTETEWPHFQSSGEPGIAVQGWGVRDQGAANGPNSCYPAVPYATASSVESEYSRCYQ